MIPTSTDSNNPIQSRLRFPLNFSSQHLHYYLHLSHPPLLETPKSTMKVHPIPRRSLHHHKKLRRLPHVFSRVLELPFRSDADVIVHESPACFRFVAEAGLPFASDNVRAHAVEIHPGVTKIVIRERGDSAAELLTLDELELDMWRFRLPETTIPELASAVFVGGELIVTVPKIEEESEAEEEVSEIGLCLYTDEE